MDCPDCGCKVYNGHCVNCHEETYIFEQYQEIEEIKYPLSDEFVEKVKEQRIEAQKLLKAVK